CAVLKRMSRRGGEKRREAERGNTGVGAQKSRERNTATTARSIQDFPKPQLFSSGWRICQRCRAKRLRQNHYAAGDQWLATADRRPNSYLRQTVRGLRARGGPGVRFSEGFPHSPGHP